MNRNEVFNSKRLSLDISSANLNSFTVKPIHGEGLKSQICVTFNKSNVNAISFYVSYRLKGANNWINTSVEKSLNVINIKNVEPGVYEVRIVAVNAKQQIPSQIKEVEVKCLKPSVTPIKAQKSVSQTVLNIAGNLAEDILSEVYFNLSSDGTVSQQKQVSYYEEKYMD